MHVVRKVVSLLLTSVTSAVLLAACHGSSTPTTSTTPPTATFTYSQAAPSTPLSLNFNGTGSKDADGTTPTYTWNFGDQIPSTSTQVLTGVTVNHIYAQPGTYVVSLTVTDDHASSAVQIQKVTVTGTPSILMGVENWTWVAGSQYANSVGAYVTQFSPNVSNQPSARQNAATWTHGFNGVPDAGGKMWMFGGGGNDSGGSGGLLNDLWYFTPATSASSCGAVTNSSGVLTSGATSGCWTWVAGSNRGNAAGSYPSDTAHFNVTDFPGARTAPAAWTDADGNFWMFGGDGYDSAGALGNLNDMWQFTGATGQAQWKAGAKIINDPGSATYPRARSFATTWATYRTVPAAPGVAAHGAATFWMFGGQSIDTTGTITVQLNDFWSYDTDTKAWTFISGSTTPATVAGVYGTQGTPASTNLPGSRINAQAWVAGGKLWMFGGSGNDSNNANGSLSDMWSYDPAAKEWTWFAGSKTINAAEATGVQGTASAANTPSARLGTVGWTDKSGTLLWMFGGSGTDSTGTSTSSDGAGALNELWVFNTSTNAWAYMGGYNIAGTAGVYANGTGIASNQNSPGSRIWSSGWLDSNNNFWLFGGAGDDMSGNSGYLNDLWMVNTTVLPH